MPQTESGLSAYDTLTGLCTQLAFFSEVRKQLQLEPNSRFCIVRFDIDRFKVYNDTFGTATGDRLLHDLGAYLLGLESGRVRWARLTSDHFVCLYPLEDCHPAHFCVRLDQWFRNYSAQFLLSGSVGIYPIDEPDLEIGLMCDRALLALLTVKHTYATRYAYFDQSLRDQLLRDQHISNSMSAALEQRQFLVYYQPQYHHSSGELIGAEALARWQDPDRGILSPEEFIPVLERNGFIVQLDRFIWEETCAFLRRRLDAGKLCVSISVNLSRMDLYNPQLPDILDGLMEKYGLDPSMLRLEITDTSYLQDFEQLVAVVKTLRARGYFIEMDGFCSSPSSLNALLHLPMDLLKLDLQVLALRENCGRFGVVLSSVVSMAHRLNLPVLVEGVETTTQADCLQVAGCRLAQGYLFAKPMPAGEFDALLDRQWIGSISPEIAFSNRKGAKEETLPHSAALPHASDPSPAANHASSSDRFSPPERMDDTVFQQLYETNNISQALASTTDIFSNLVANLPIGIGIYELGTPTRLLFVSDRTCAMFGCTREEYQRRVLQGLPPANQPSRDTIPEEELAKMDAGLPFSYTVHAQRKNGNWFWLRIFCRILQKPGAPSICYATLADVTEQFETEDRLRMIEQEMGFAMLQMGKMIYRYDLASRTLTVPQRDAQPSGQTVHLQHVLLRDLYRYQLDRESRHRLLACYRDLLHGAKRGSLELHVQRENGTWGWDLAEYVTLFDSAGKPVKAVIALEDVTAQHAQAAENREIRHREHMLRLVAKHSNRIIVRYDLDSRTAHMESDLADHDYLPPVEGQMPEAVLARGAVLPESVEEYRAFFDAVLAGKPGGDARIHLRASDGKNRWYDMKFSQIFYPGEAPASIVISYQEITAEHERELAYQKYLQSIDQATTSNALFFETDITADQVEKMGGDLLPDDLPEERSHSMLFNWLLVRNFAEGEKERARSYFSREHLLALYADGIRTLADDWLVVFQDKAQHWMHSDLQLVSDPYTEHIKAYAQMRDITEEKNSELGMIRRAEQDGMTGLLNKVTVEARISAALSRQDGGVCALLIADIDDLKYINDTFGHDRGDEAIIAFAAALKAQFRSTDLIGRIGGDEFIIFLTGVKNDQIIRKLAHSLACRLLEIQVGEPASVPVHGSIGVAIGETGREAFPLLRRQADQALYHIKRSGKSDYAVYTSEMENTGYQLPANSPLFLRKGAWFHTAELHRLMSAIALFFPLVLSVNLSQNSYSVMEHVTFDSKCRAQQAGFDQYIEEHSLSFHPEDRASWIKAFSPGHLLEAYAQNKKCVFYEGRKCSLSGGYDWVRTVAIFAGPDENGDVYGIVLSHPMEECACRPDRQRLLQVLESAAASNFEHIYLVHIDSGTLESLIQVEEEAHAGRYEEAAASLRDRVTVPTLQDDFWQCARLDTVVRCMEQTAGHYSFRYRLQDGIREAEFYYCEPSRQDLLLTVRRIP